MKHNEHAGIISVVWVILTIGQHCLVASAFSPPTQITPIQCSNRLRDNGARYQRHLPYAQMVQSSETATSDKHEPATTSSDMPQLSSSDPELHNLIVEEDSRQRLGLELIASENFCSASVREALGSCLTNKYSEGNVGKRYYGGNQYIDEIEALCMHRALSLYGLSNSEDSDDGSGDGSGDDSGGGKCGWGVNVQPYSGSPANFAVYTALLQPHDRIMGLDLPSGGHLTHGFQTKKRKVSATSVYFESLPYVVDEQTGFIDYDEMERRAQLFMPKLLIAGGSAYPREWDYRRMRQIADSVGAYYMVDMAHTSGLIAADLLDSPFQYADVVTTTTHKTLRGPRSGMIFAKSHLMSAIDTAVFPSLQGGPHNHQIAGVATALKEANTPEFRTYARNVIRNASALAEALIQKGYSLTTGGTDNHLLLWDVRPIGLTGNKVEKVLEMIDITTNKNSVPGDTSAINPGGIRIGTPALTTRGMDENDFKRVADFLDRGCQLAIDAQNIAREEQQQHEQKSKVLLKDFLKVFQTNGEIQSRVLEIQNEVETFASSFPMV